MKRLSKAELGRELGVSASAVGQYENGKSKPKTEVLLHLNKLLEYDFINDRPQKTSESNGSAPYYPDANASAGLSFLTDNSNNAPSNYIKIPGLKVDAYINVFGDSMHPLYQSGQIIGIRKIEKDMVHYGYAYVVEMIDGEAYLKYIQPGKDNDHWSLESENPHYSATEFHISKIRNIYKIKSILTRKSL